MSRPRRQQVLVAAFVLVLALLGTVQAQAAGLSLYASKTVWRSGTIDRTCTGPVQVTPAGAPVNGAYSQLKVTGLNGACTGLGSVRLGTSTGTVLVTNGTATAAGGGFTVTVPAFTPPTATKARPFVSVGTWPVPAAWVPPVNPLGSCVGIDTTANSPCTVKAIVVQGSWGDAGTHTRVLGLQVSLTGLEPTSWGTPQFDVQLNLAGVVPSDWRWATSSATGSSWTPYPGGRCSSLPSLHVYAPAWAWNGSQVYLELDESGSGSLCS